MPPLSAIVAALLCLGVFTRGCTDPNVELGLLIDRWPVLASKVEPGRSLASSVHVETVWFTRAFTSGSPSDERTYRYTPGDGTLLVEEALTGTSHRHTWTYAQGLLLSESFLHGDPGMPQSAVRTYEYKNGRLDKRTDERGIAHLHRYDTDRGLLVQVETQGPGASSHTATFTYDLAGNLIRQEDAEGFVTEIGYDGFGRPVTWRWPDAAGPGLAISEAVRLDAMGNEVERRFGSGWRHAYTSRVNTLGFVRSQVSGDLQVDSTSDFDPAGRPTESKDLVTGLGVEQSYDLLGRPLSTVRKVQTPEGERKHTTTFSYEDNPSGLSTLTLTETVEGPSAPADWTKTTVHTLDAMGRLVSSRDTVDGQERLVFYAYDPRETRARPRPSKFCGSQSPSTAVEAQR